MGSHCSPGQRRPRWKGDDGASLIEYALLVALIAFICVSALVYFQQATSTSLSKSSSSLTNAGN
jgi:Flp pilus assembly pilin Flp